MYLQYSIYLIKGEKRAVKVGLKRTFYIGLISVLFFLSSNLEGWKDKKINP